VFAIQKRKIKKKKKCHVGPGGKCKDGKCKKKKKKKKGKFDEVGVLCSASSS